MAPECKDVCVHALIPGPLLLPGPGRIKESDEKEQ